MLQVVLKEEPILQSCVLDGLMEEHQLKINNVLPAVNCKVTAWKQVMQTPNVNCFQP